MKYCFAFIAIILATVHADGTVDVTEDTLGNYRFSIRTADVQKTETRTADGSIAGSFSYTDDKGRQHQLQYAGSEREGFRADGADVPVSVPEGHEILSARREHLAALAGEGSAFPGPQHVDRPVSVGEVLHKLATEFRGH